MRIQKVIGTGIGLATCKRIVEPFEDRIWLESKIGKGIFDAYLIKNGR